MKHFFKNIIPDYFLKIRQYHLAYKWSLKKTKDREVLDKKHKALVKKLISSDTPIKIEIGSGPRPGTNGWLTLDLHAGCDLQMNLLETLPFPDNTVDMIYSSHFLEHFQTAEMKLILKECYRILKPGGKISTCVPDSSTYINAYSENKELDPGVWLRYTPAADINSKIDYINYIGHLNGEHKHLFDLENLLAIQKLCGFVNVKERNFIAGLDMEVRDYQSIYTEAIK